MKTISSGTKCSEKAGKAESAFNKRYFQDALLDHGITQRELAAELGMDASALSLTFSNRRRLQLDEAPRLAKRLNLPLVDVLKNAGVEPPKVNPVMLRGYVDAAGEAHYFPKGRIRPVSCPIEMPDEAMAFQFHTAMSPLEFMDGWIVFSPPAKGVLAEGEFLNRLCIVGRVDGGVMVGFVKRGYAAGKYSVYIGGVALADVAVKWVAPVKMAVMAED